MKTDSYEVECLYKAFADGMLTRPQEWRVYMSDYNLAVAQNIVSAVREKMKDENCNVIDCRIIKVTREVI